MILFQTKGLAKFLMTKNKGRLFLVSGPSGVGKGTICRELLKQDKELFFSVSATTRKPRNEDVEGKTYYFKTKEQFEKLIEENEFLEWAEYSGNYYGTPKTPVLERLESGVDVLLEIDVKGALSVMENFDEGVYIFIAPPDESALLERLKNRGTESEEDINKRLTAAKEELKLKSEYDYVVINDILDTAVSEVKNIILKERNNK